MDRRSGRNGHHYEKCTLTVVTNLTGSYAEYPPPVTARSGERQ